MPEPKDNSPATVPEQPEAKPPLRKTMPVVVALVVIMALIGIANLSNLMRGNRKAVPAGSLPVSRPAAPSAQQVNSFETQQQLEAQRDAQERQHAQEMAAAMQQLQATDGIPGPEGAGMPPMTAAQRAAIYGDSSNAPLITSGASEER
ncbi:MAG: conjugal transfer protein TrbI, partial [Acidobacteriaceae bacterium]